MVAVLSCIVCGTRKRLLLLPLALIALTTILLSAADNQLKAEELLSLKLGEMRNELEFLISTYRAKQEEIIELQLLLRDKLNVNRRKESIVTHPEVTTLIKHINDSRLAAGLKTERIHGAPYVYQLLPHHMDSPRSLYPGYHLKGPRKYSEYVIGIPTVKRDKENYLLITLEHLLIGLMNKFENTTTIVVCVGETDLQYVLQIAQQILTKFPKQVESGMIEVISPSETFYPDFSGKKPNLGDSQRRFNWRSKQNLDAIFLMGYAQTKGMYYLMLEDDVIAVPTFMETIKKFTISATVSNPDWVFIEYCTIGGIGKLFKSSTLKNFVMYLELFYQSMPIDWLLEKYLENLECALFQNSEIQTDSVPKFYPHRNPKLASITTSIKTHGQWSLLDAYLGLNYFWGIKPMKGDFVEFILKEPTVIKSYLFRSGNVEHISDRFQNTIVEVTPSSAEQNATAVGSFDEFGLAEGTIKKDIGPIHAVRLKVLQDHKNWVILSEISLVPYGNESSVSTTSKQLLTRLLVEKPRKMERINKTVN